MRQILMLLALLFSTQLIAQTEIQPVAVYTKDGNVLRGKVIERVPGKSLELELKDGQRVTIQAANIQRVYGKKDRHILLPDGTAFRSGGVYKNYHIQSMFGRSSRTEGDQTVFFGVGNQFTAGWQFNQYFGLGGTIGLSYYGNVMGDLSLNIRGELTKKKISPTYALDAGYGAPVSTRSIGNNSVINRGGMLFRPSLGLRVATHRRSNLLIDVGYAFQQYYSEFDGWGGWNDVRQGWFRRASVRVGWTW